MQVSGMQELQDDLSKLMHLNGTKTEIQLGYYPPNGAQYVRHRDAFPDDGSESDQRRVSHLHFLPQSCSYPTSLNERALERAAQGDL